MSMFKAGMSSSIDAVRSLIRAHALVDSKTSFTVEEIEQVLAEVEQIASRCESKYARLLEEVSR